MKTNADQLARESTNVCIYYNQILFSNNKKWITVICNSMSEYDNTVSERSPAQKNSVSCSTYEILKQTKPNCGGRNQETVAWEEKWEGIDWEGAGENILVMKCYVSR